MTVVNSVSPPSQADALADLRTARYGLGVVTGLAVLFNSLLLAVLAVPELSSLVPTSYASVNPLETKLILGATALFFLSAAVITHVRYGKELNTIRTMTNE